MDDFAEDWNESQFWVCLSHYLSVLSRGVEIGAEHELFFWGGASLADRERGKVR